jgi:hypothetical protein
VNSNNKKLLNTLEKIVKQLDLPYSHQQALMEADFRLGFNVNLQNVDFICPHPKSPHSGEMPTSGRHR